MNAKIHNLESQGYIDRLYAKFDEMETDNVVGLIRSLGDDDQGLLDDVEFLLSLPATRDKTHTLLRAAMADITSVLLA